MHVHETFWRQVGWFGWLAHAAVIYSWTMILVSAITGSVRQDHPWWWLISVPVSTAMIAWMDWTDWRRVQRRRAVIRRITGGTRPGSRLVRDDEIDSDVH